MSIQDYLQEKCGLSRAQYIRGNTNFYTHPADSFVEPFRIADDLWYVGDAQVCVHLIDTHEGLILLDSGFPCAVPSLIEAIHRAGFDPRDVKWILHTHGHFDHFGASETFRRLFGTRLAISRVDAQALRENSARALMDWSSMPFAPVPEFDYEIEDGEVFRLGDKEIRCVLTPGHTAGVLSFFFPVTENGQEHLAGLFGGIGTNTLSLSSMLYYDDPKDLPEQLLASLALVEEEPVTVHLGNHPPNNHTLEKRHRMVEEGGNPFVDAGSWKAFIEATRPSVHRMLEINAQMRRELDELR